MSGPAPIIIIGGGGHGRGILEILLAEARAAGAACPVAGFLDEDPGVVGSTRAGRPVLGGLDEMPRLVAAGHQFILGVGDPRARQELAGRITAAGVVYARAVHPRATLYSDVVVAPGCVVAAGVTVAAAARLGEHTLLNLNATLGHDCILEAFATVAPGANLGGHVRLGRAAFASLNATILPGLTVGENSQVGAGSVLLEDLEPDRIAFGVPARVVSRSNTW